MSMKKQLLDPLGTLCKLVALNFNEKNTKISIQNHILEVQRPYGYQFLVRIYNGDGRENISELYYVIIRIIKWYLIIENKALELQQSEESPESDLIRPDNYLRIAKSEGFRKMVRYLCDGFKKLQETYEFGNVVLALQYYINLLEEALDGRYNDKQLPDYIIRKDREYANLLDYDKLRNFWDDKKIERICELYDNCFKVYNDDTPENQKDKIIDGYLRSIDVILNITDREFQNLITNSNKG